MDTPQTIKPFLTHLAGTYAGLLFALDPHVTSRKPGTRNDQSFLMTVIGKLDQAAAIANERNLVTVIPGDLFDLEHLERAGDDLMMTLLIRTLNKFNEKPFVLAANHDMSETRLTDDTAMAVLKEAGVIDVVDYPGIFLLVNIEHHGEARLVAVGGSPHGMTIPTDVAPLLAEIGAEPDCVGWITHEDMAFDGAYPGAKEVFEIDGCSWVVNGHMHLTKKPLKAGKTIWHNPGNIVRLSKDCAGHIPSVWEMSAVGALTRIPLDHVADVFESVKGRVAANADGATMEKTSEFVEMLKACTIAANADVKTEDGSVLLADIAAVCQERKASIGAVNILTALHEMVVV